MNTDEILNAMRQEITELDKRKAVLQAGIVAIETFITPELSAGQIKQLLLKRSMRVADLTRHYNCPADRMKVFLENNGFEIIRAGWVRAKPDSQK